MRDALQRLMVELHWSAEMSVITFQALPTGEADHTAARVERSNVEALKKITVPSLLQKKLLHQPITAVTAYDYASARLVDDAGLDLLLVGDSLAMVELHSAA